MENRRNFIKKAGLLSAGAALSPSIIAAERSIIKPDETDEPVRPTAAQKAWMDLGFGMFIHYGINTYYDKEWSDGTLDPSVIDPQELDTDQWCTTAKAAGMKYIVLVTKHHDGYCNWPTNYTDYSVNATPSKKDITGELVNSARKHGLKVGFYYSLWDRHEKLHDEDEYKYVLDFMKPQLEELLTNYGEVAELWFDGFWKKQQTGWAKPITDDMGEKVHGTPESEGREDNFVKSWRMEGAYRWQMDHIYQFVKTLQPDCMVMNNATTSYPGVPLHPVDIRSGEKYTRPNKNDRKVWNWLGKDVYLPLQIETTMSVKGNKKFKTGNWFWHDWDHSVADKELIKTYLGVSKQMQANLLLNCGPMANGRLRPEDVKVLNSLQD
jgi:alpha-L-fucosidase